MHPIHRLFCRAYQTVFRIALPILPYREPKLLDSADSAALLLREKQIDKTTMGNALRTFRRYNLVALLDKDLTKEESRIVIYDTILMAVRVEDIKRVSDLIALYRKGGAESESFEESTID